MYVNYKQFSRIIKTLLPQEQNLTTKQRIDTECEFIERYITLNLDTNKMNLLGHHIIVQIWDKDV